MNNIKICQLFIDLMKRIVSYQIMMGKDHNIPGRHVCEDCDSTLTFLNVDKNFFIESLPCAILPKSPSGV